MEFFSPERVTKEIKTGAYPSLQTTEPAAFDLQEGWDFFDAKDRKLFWDTLEAEDPDLVLMTPECRGFSTLMQVNWQRGYRLQPWPCFISAFRWLSTD